MKHGLKRRLAWLLSLIILGCVLDQPVTAKAKTKMSVRYAVHIQNLGDSQGYVNAPQVAGTSGLGYRLEAISIQLTGNEYKGNVVYKTHVQNEGWQSWKKNGEESGSRGYGRRLEGIEIYLTGEVAKHYDIEYRVHCQTYGWLPWVRNGVMSGTSGESKRLEAVQIKLYGEVAKHYNVYYRVHAQQFGWLGWAKNGENAGTEGYAYRLEKIEIKLMAKDADTSAEDASGDAFKKNNNPITPPSSFTADQADILALSNQNRSANGVSQMLSLDPTLCKAAQKRAEEIVTSFSHTRPNGESCFSILDEYGYDYWTAGENIAAGYGNASSVMNGWMNSSGHRANILNGSYTKLGVGCVRGKGTYGIYWVQLFATPSK